MWLTHPDFPGIVREAWASQTRLSAAVSNFVDKARIWNKNIFGNLFHRKKRVLARLGGIQAAFSVNPNTFLVDLERDLRAEFNEIAKLEEEFWAMKSRITWLVEGDRNTSFYHTSASIHRRRNRISCMKDSVGNWIQGEREIADYIRKGFSDLFTSGHSYAFRSAWSPPFWNHCLNKAEAETLVRPVSNDDITASLWNKVITKAVLMGAGFGRLSLSRKSSALCDSAYTRAFRLVLFLQQGVWKFFGVPAV
ncbi:hypothetical protein CMV_010108 [Castanea mollissima]|uniref:Reverse transcriptase n=1 Tax=Castanea mollissima TaxID=60419 RepID=A0A8J4R8S5_9ROSI|nr:hypothetical protein CMV_010108 [Castanea mollissima]